MGTRCLKAGAFGLTIHPRPDQRHAKYSDITELKAVVAQFPGTELNIEGYPTPEFMQRVIAAQPHQCTLVPDAPDQLTSDHGWDVHAHRDLLAHIIRDLKQANIRVSLFMDADNTQQLPLVRELNADRIELYTEPYALAFDTAQEQEVLQRFIHATQSAIELGLGVNAGHDLNLQNLGLLCKSANILEVSIGHALTVECFDYGLEGTIKRYLDILK
jgi:pyridoxine 5-phosphate synthase